MIQSTNTLQQTLPLDGKECLACQQLLPLSAFYDNPSNTRDGKTARCIPCRKEQVRLQQAAYTKPKHFRSIVRAKTKMAVEAPKKPMADRYNTGKADYSLLPIHLLEGAVRVLEKGANKYSAWNWAKGMPWSTPYACAMRHLAAWHRGETNDSETNENHIDHAICNLIMLKPFAEAYQEGDDRPSAFFSGDGISAKPE